MGDHEKLVRKVLDSMSDEELKKGSSTVTKNLEDGSQDYSDYKNLGNKLGV